MKATTKVMALLLALTMCVGLAACNNAQGNGEAPINFSLGLSTDGKYEGYTAKNFVTLGQYTNMELPEDVVTVTEEDVQKQVDSIMEKYPAKLEVTDRAVKDKDTVNIDYTGYVNGEAFENGSTNGNGTEVTIGTTQYIDDFLEQLIGHNPGETFDIEVTFPDPYTTNPDLAGKDATFTVTINKIIETHTYELTDDFVVNNLQKTYGYTSVADMKAKIADELLQNQIGTYVWDTVFENASITDVPEKLVENEFKTALKEMNYYALNYSSDLKTMLTYYYGVEDEATFRSKYKEQMTKQVQYYMMVQAIAEDAGLFATEEDVTKYFTDKMGTSDPSDYIKNYGKGYIYRAVTMDKVNTYLLENNPVPVVE